MKILRVTLAVLLIMSLSIGTVSAQQVDESVCGVNIDVDSSEVKIMMDQDISFEHKLSEEMTYRLETEIKEMPPVEFNIDSSEEVIKEEYKGKKVNVDSEVVVKGTSEAAVKGTMVDVITSVVSLPDLRLYNVVPKSGTTYPFEANGYAYINYTIANYSSTEVSNVQIGVKVNGNLIHTYTYGDIPAWTGYISTLNLGGVPEGDYDIELVADVNNLISETDETNNSSTATMIWVGTPDLVATTLQGEGSYEYEVGTGVDYAIRVDNNGTGKVNGTTSIYITVNNSPIYGWTITNFSKNGYLEKEFQLTFNETGNYEVGLIVDYNNEVMELSEANNTLTNTLSIIMASTVQVSGKFELKKYETVADIGVTIPAEGLKVIVMDDDVSFDDILGTTYTDSAGNFSINVNNQSHENGCDIFLVVELDNDCVEVRNHSASNDIYKWTSGTNSNYTGSSLSFGTTNLSNLDNDLDGAMNLFYWINFGADYYESNMSDTGSKLTKATIIWEDGVDDGSYCSGTSLYMNGKTTDADQYDAGIILHEYGHFIMGTESDFPTGSGGNHNYMTPSSFAVAYSEGYSHYVSTTMRGSTEIKDYTSATSYYGIDIENCRYINDLGSMTIPVQSPYIENGKMEAMVGAVLNDLGDTNNDASDTFSTSHKHIDDVMRSVMQSVHEFFTSFYNKGYASGSKELVWNIFDEYNVSYDMVVPNVSISPIASSVYLGSATDNVKVSKMEWYLDGILMSTTTNASTTYTIPSVSEGSHTLTLRAYDPEAIAGNFTRPSSYGSASYTFTVASAIATATEPKYFKNAVEEFDSINEAKLINAVGEKKKAKTKEGKSEYNFKISKSSDVVLSGLVNGAIEKISVVDKNGSVVAEANELTTDGGFIVKDLEKGKYSVEIKTVDTDREVSYTISAFSKPIKPQLTFKEIIDSQAQTLKNEYEDTLIVQVNEDTIELKPGESAEIKYKEGNNNITYYLSDGNYQSEETEKIVFVDTAVPVITVNEFYAKDTRGIMNAELSEGVASLTINGEEKKVGEFGNNFAYVFNLKDELESISIIAIDYAGNRTTISVPVDFN